MRRLALAGLLCGALTASGAESVQPAAAPSLVAIERQGYAFEFPRVLAEQRLFGIAHGIALLAEACSHEPVQAQSTAQAYRQWYEQQQLLIDDLKHNLAVFYYGPNAAQASWSHIASALNLRTRVSPEPGSEQMAAACASLPEALQQPRYDLNALFQLEAALAATAVAIRAEAQTAACLPRLAEPARNALQAAHAEWQRSESAAAEQAQAQLQQQWKNTRSGGSFEEWKQAVSGGYTRTPQALCDRLAVWLRSPAAKLEQSFAPAPVLTPGVEDEPAPDNSVMAVQLSQPESAVQPLADTAPETPAPGATPTAAQAGLFDTLMKAFDERPYESRAPRSQRAHP